MEIKYIGEQALSYLVGKMQEAFATITHKHTAEEVGADASGSASAALALSEQYTDERIAEKIFVGTYAEYQAANAEGKIKEGCIVLITDDQNTSGGSGDSSDTSSTSAVLGVAILGQMKLG